MASSTSWRRIRHLTVAVADGVPDTADALERALLEAGPGSIGVAGIERQTLRHAIATLGARRPLVPSLETLRRTLGADADGTTSALPDRILALLPVALDAVDDVRIVPLRVTTGAAPAGIEILVHDCDARVREAAGRAASALRAWIAAVAPGAAGAICARVELLGVSSRAWVEGGSLALPVALAVLAEMSGVAPHAGVAATGGLSAPGADGGVLVTSVSWIDRKAAVLRTPAVRELLCPEGSMEGSTQPGLRAVGTLDDAIARAFDRREVCSALRRRSRHWPRRASLAAGALAASLVVAGGSMAAVHETRSRSQLAEVGEEASFLLEAGQLEDAFDTLRLGTRDLDPSDELAEAWMELADRAETTETGPQIGLRALAQARIASVSQSQQDKASIGLVEAWVRRHRWSEAAATLARIDLERQDEDVAGRIALAQSKIALGLWDFDALNVRPSAVPPSLLGALASFRGVAPSVGTAQRSSLLDLDGDGSLELYLPVDGRWVDVSVDPALSPLSAFPWPADAHAPPVWVGGNPERLVWSEQTDISDMFRNHLMTRSESGWMQTDEWVGGSVDQVAWRDGVAWFSEPFGSRSVRAILPEGRVGPPIPAIESAGSVVRALTVADVDLDGRDELLLGVSEWNTFELWVMDGETEGSLSVEQRLPVGNITALTVIGGGQGEAPLVVAAVGRVQRGLPLAPDAPAPGLVLFRGTPEGLREAGRVTLPAPYADAVRLGTQRLLQADLDQDGHTDLVSGWEVDGSVTGRATWVLRGLGTGSFEGLVLDGARPLALVEADGDSLPEWLLLAEGGGNLLAGLGPRAPARRPVASRVAGTPAPSGVDTRRWEDASSWATQGLHAEASSGYEAAGRRATEADAHDESLMLAGAEADAASQWERALDLWEQVRFEPARSAAIERALQLSLDLGDLEDVTRFASLAAAQDSRQAAELLVSAASAPSTPLVGVSLLGAASGLGPPGSTWLREDGGVTVDARSGTGELLRLPLLAEGPIQEVEVFVDIERAEWASGLRLSLVDHGDELVGMSVSAQGGGGHLMRIVACLARQPDEGAHTTTRLPVGGAEEATRLRVRLRVVPGLAKVSCAVHALEGDHWALMARRSGHVVGTPGQPSLRLASSMLRPESWWLRAVLHDLRLHGLVPGESAPTAVVSGDRALAVGDAAAAIMSYGPAGGPDRAISLRRGVALALDGQSRAAVLALRASIDPTTPPQAWAHVRVSDAVHRDLADLSRTSTESLGEALEEALGPERWMAVCLRDARFRADRNNADTSGALRALNEAERVFSRHPNWSAEMVHEIESVRADLVPDAGRGSMVTR